MDPEKTILLVEDNSDDEALALRRHTICKRVDIARDGTDAENSTEDNDTVYAIPGNRLR